MKTLIVAPNWIGDALMAQPLLTLLAHADPAATTVVLAPRWVAPVMAAMSEVDDVIATDLAHGALQWAARRALAQTIAARGFDRAFVLPNSFKSALVPWLAGIPQRVGYRGEARYGLINRRADGPDAGLSMSARYAALARKVGVDVPATLPQPRLTVAATTVADVRRRFGLGLGFDETTELIALCPGAEYGPAKRWPATHFATLATMLLAERPDAHVLLLGGDGDRSTCEAIGAEATRRPDATARLHDLCGRTDLSDAIALIAASSSVVSNDSGLMHVAAALGRPQVALFGSSDPRHTPPLSPHATTLWLHLDCSPCFERTCPLGHLDCLVGIAPQRVLDSLQNTDPLPWRPLPAPIASRGIDESPPPSWSN